MKEIDDLLVNVLDDKENMEVKEIGDETKLKLKKKHSCRLPNLGIDVESEEITLSCSILISRLWYCAAFCKSNTSSSMKPWISIR